ncbi:trypsin [Dictyocaulus viviparus]|uniref:Trypsin n=1 Tax=Dictyocaulus viviparus TaxID=29172 RepID=A0A0D8XBP0_DICVI|nr:trypsin [Dictyocaulus viviparus]
MRILWLLVLIPPVLSENITAEENEALKHECGYHRLPENSRQVRSIGGKDAEKNEFPWIAAILQTREGQRSTQRGICSGVQISRIHILTAAHCLVKARQGVDCMRYDLLPLSDITIYAGSSCLEPLTCPTTKTEYHPKEILIHPDYDPCKSRSDFALITLTTNISKTDGLPICTPSKEGDIPKNLTAIGFGIDTTQKSVPKLRSVELSFRKEIKKDKLITTRDTGKSTCSGDSGGPLVRINSTGTYFVIGTTIGSNPKCNVKRPLTEGVCPLPETDEVISGC